MIDVDKDIPIPAKGHGKGGGRKAKWPWAKLEVGDSFFMPGASYKTANSSICAARKHQIFFTMRKVTEDSVVGIRIWRIAAKKEPVA